MARELSLGARGPEVERLQLALDRLGYPEPRYGADGILGRLTLDLVDQWGLDRDVGVDCTPNDSVDRRVHENILNEAAPKISGAGYPLVIDGRSEAWERRRRRKNPIGRIDTVVLHQMAVKDSDNIGWKRWRKLAIHYVVTCGPGAQTVQLHDLDWRQGHAQGWNRRSVGFELEGYFAGIHGVNKTFWRPKSRPNRQPMVPDPMQIEAALQGVRHAIETIAAMGGHISYIAAHRQSYGIKTSDPGQLIWQGVALPLIAEGLVEEYPGVLHHPKYPGRPIPEAWNPANAGVPYR